MRIEAAHHRRSIRLQDYDYGQPGAYYVTIIAHLRACLFGWIVDGEMRLSERGKIAQACWTEIPQHFPQSELGAFVVMPNHVHGILVLHASADASASARRAAIISPVVGAQHAAPLPTPPTTFLPTAPRRPRVASGSLGAIVRSYKAAVTRQIVRESGASSHVWQRNYYEHIIRSADEWRRIHLYMEGNPMGWAHDEENPANI